jgi:hypothetical protein
MHRGRHRLELPLQSAPANWQALDQMAERLTLWRKQLGAHDAACATGRFFIQVRLRPLALVFFCQLYDLQASAFIS